MKKIYILILFILLSLIIIIIYFNCSRNEFDSFYAIKESKGYILKDDRKMHIDIYSKLEKSLISYNDKNIYQIKDKNEIYNLENVNVETSKIDDLYVNRINADLINTTNENLIIEDAILLIKNESYSLKIHIGYISILNPINYELLSFNKYYGSYSYLNGSLELVGINLELTDKFNILSNFWVNNYAKGNLKNILFNLYENEINIKDLIPSYNPYYMNDDEIKLKNNILFIPISYINILMIKEAYITLNLDGEDFYIDHFNFINNFINYNDYKELLEEGEINYAKSS